MAAGQAILSHMMKELMRMMESAMWVIVDVLLAVSGLIMLIQ